jgi:hypothetical protein
VLAQADIGGPLLPASVYLAGGVLFCTGGYTSIRVVADQEGSLVWTSAVVLFAGTLVFAVNLVDSFIAELTPRQADRLIWSPDVVGCVLFLASGHMAMMDLSGGWRPCWRPASREWWIVAINQAGSALFMVAALASFVHSDGDLLAAGVANWGTFAGALCFAIAGLVQEPRRAAPA